MCKFDATNYKVDERAINFLVSIQQDDLIDGGEYLDIKSWTKVYEFWMNIIRKWLTDNKDIILQKLNIMLLL